MIRSILARFDRFTVGILTALALGLVLPCSGQGQVLFSGLSQTMILLLFFFYGLRISRQAIVDGFKHWRLQGMVLLCTFVFFPLLMLGARPALEWMVGPALFLGLLYVSCIPSTVQSSVVFTSIAKGNVPAAVCSASISSLVGVFATPFLVNLLFPTESLGNFVGLESVLNIAQFILLPFVVGQCSQRWLQNWALSHKTIVSLIDQSTVWLLVYTSFSAATVAGYWQQNDASDLLWLVLACFLLLCFIHATIYYTSKWLGFKPEDRYAIVFCGSKKSLTGGAPMMLALFGYVDNNYLLPLMIFHQIQLLTCSHLSRMWQAHQEQGEQHQASIH